MIEILQNKYSATRFEILVEIAASGPNVQQRQIAAKLGITPQAVSDYIHRMVEDGSVISAGRSSYRVSVKGVNWMLEMLRELRDYVSHVTTVVTDITTCAAIAETDIIQGQTVGLKMIDGLLYATSEIGEGARGVSASDVKRGEDADITRIGGLVELRRGKVIILQVPSIGKGGSRQVNLKRLKSCANQAKNVGAIGIEALVALRRAEIEPKYLYGVTEASVEAVHCGLSVVIACTDDAIPGLIKRMQEENLDYEIVDLSKKS
ncbi:MAG: MarR family transcriptional regulator [Dehalococcoidia bacterium]